MKKLLALALAGTAVATAMTGCGDKGTTATFNALGHGKYGQNVTVGEDGQFSIIKAEVTVKGDTISNVEINETVGYTTYTMTADDAAGAAPTNADFDLSDEYGDMYAQYILISGNEAATEADFKLTEGYEAASEAWIANNTPSGRYVFDLVEVKDETVEKVTADWIDALTAENTCQNNEEELMSDNHNDGFKDACTYNLGSFKFHAAQAALSALFEGLTLEEVKAYDLDYTDKNGMAGVTIGEATLYAGAIKEAAIKAFG